MEDSTRSSVDQLHAKTLIDNGGPDPVNATGSKPCGEFPALEEIQPVLSGFHQATGVSIGLVSHPHGQLLSQYGWQSLCQSFHLADPHSAKICRESCRCLLESLNDNGEPSLRMCEFGMTDGAFPIHWDGKHVGTLFLGQVLTENPDPHKFVEIARKYGYDSDIYLAALARVPRMGKERLADQVRFLRDTISRICGLHQSIREQNETESKLVTSRESYRSLVRNLPEILLRLDRGGTILAVNRTLDGSPAEMVVGTNIVQYVAHEFQPNARKIIKKVLEQGKPGNLEIQAVGPNGPGKAWYEVRVLPVMKEGRVDALTMIATDITRRKTALKALVESELKYQTMLDSLEEGYFELDLQGNLIFVNDAMCRIYDLPREDILGLGYRQYTRPETAQSLFEVFNRIYRTGEPVKVVSYQILKMDRTEVSLQLSASLKIVEGAPVGFRCICRDITHILEAQKEKDRLEKKLMQAQKLEAIGTLAGGVAHDFNNLLTGLQGNVSLMLRDMDPAHPHYDRIQSIEDYIAAATGLTRQLLGFARGGKYEVKTLDINNLVDRTLTMFGRASKEVSIHRDFQASWAVDADSGQLEQVLLNLFVNAWQAMPDGGDLYILTQNVFLDEIFVRPYSIESGKFLKISVTDTGHGMDEATQQKVFDPFFTTKDVSRGTGLGLSSAYGIIKNHQGLITVYSTPGKGTTFNIFLPAAAKEIVAEEKTSLGVLYGTETLLLVDDEEVIIKTGGEILEALGYKVFLAEHARKAVEIFNAHHQEIDMVILDMIMPDMTGEEVYDHFKIVDPKVRVLLSSGYSLNGQAVEIMRKGCNGFIQKPFNLEQLSHKIREVLDQTCSE
ncbi:MAG: PocR ligand-binding domain-containing protein [Desulfatibacillum sp.]|nr:PocR ligand-binding domain-containing protein [Desulfatibacillum sp.]